MLSGRWPKSNRTKKSQIKISTTVGQYQSSKDVYLRYFVTLIKICLTEVEASNQPESSSRHLFPVSRFISHPLWYLHPHQSDLPLPLNPPSVYPMNLPSVHKKSRVPWCIVKNNRNHDSTMSWIRYLGQGTEFCHRKMFFYHLYHK